ncbi:MAG TPA: amino acid aminotransferase [Microvirga sp.]|nr:amino acid aminotransferase [Microvirga sp.]
MFEKLQPQPADALLALIKLFRDDPRADKIDLGVGVYRNESGNTPVFEAVKAAERTLLETQATKAYLGPEGDLRFVELLRPIVFGADLGARLTGIQTPGGSGALRLAAGVAAGAAQKTRIWVGAPTWPNHAPIFAAAGLEVVEYPYFDLKRQELLFDEMISHLEQAQAGDVVLLHGCCHNPTGADLDLGQWDAVAELMSRRGLLPLVDFAYQGLGEGLEADAQGLRRLIPAVDEILVAYSCDKNFGLYRDRVGAVYALARNANEAATAGSNLATLARVNWSMPPDHGAAAVRIILDSAELTRLWHGELERMCRRINDVRRALAAAEPALAFLTRQHGLFGTLAMTKDVVARLRSEHGIYIAGSGRFNLAGLQTSEADTFVHALRAVGALADHEQAA